MRKTVLIVPGWLSEGEAESALRERLPCLESLSELGETFLLAPPADAETPEAAWLGLDPERIRLAQGPLTVAAFGYEPPDRSVHFHLSLLALDGEGKVSVPEFEIADEQARAVLDVATRLNTRSLSVLEGERADHALVWENGSLDMATRRPREAIGAPLRDSLPEGDGESLLRRLIDDSVNLLSELPFNLQRVDEGRPMLNLLWPWGQGIREPVPNLALARGEPVWVESRSLRLEGLARLARYKHGVRNALGKGTNLRLERLLETANLRQTSILFVDEIARFRAESRFEEAAWLTSELDRRLLSPLLKMHLEHRGLLAILAPSTRPDARGLALWVESGKMVERPLPFDERALEERGLTERAAWRAIEEALLWRVRESS